MIVQDLVFIQTTSADFNWDEIFKDCAWFHITGITPALCDNVAKLTIEACKKAKEHGVKISCDLNYRNKLWSKEKAGEVMAKICEYVDVCIANEEDAADVFGIKASDTDVTSGEVNREGYKEVASELTKRFGFEKSSHYIKRVNQCEYQQLVRYVV